MEFLLDSVGASKPETPVLTEYHHNAQGAIRRLMQDQAGEALAALHHPDVGDIDLVWGVAGTGSSDGHGLAKLVKFHPEVLKDLQGIVSAMEVKRRSPNRMILESADHLAVIRLDWDGSVRKWLLTAYEKKSGGSAARTDTSTAKTKDDTASLDTATLVILPHIFDAVNLTPLQRARLSSQLAAMVVALGEAKAPIQRARLAKSVNDLLIQLGGLDSASKKTGPIELTGLELGEFHSTPEGIKALRMAAIAELESMLGDWVPCPALGFDVELRRAGLKKVKSSSADPRKLKIIPVLKKLIGSAVKVGVKPNYDKANSPNILEYQTLRSLVTLEGQALAVRFVVGKDDKGAYHYDHTVFLSEVIFDGSNENGRTGMSPLILPGGNQGFTQSRSALSGPTRLLPTEPSAEQQDGRILDDSRTIVKPHEVFNLFLEGEEVEMGSPNPDEQVLADIVEGRKDDRPLNVLWSLIYQAAADLQENELLTGDTETLAQDAITHWAELEEKTDV